MDQTRKNCLASILQAHLRKGHPWPARAIGFWDQRRWRANSNTKRLDQQKLPMWKLHNLGLFPRKFKQFSLSNRAFCRVQNGYNLRNGCLELNSKLLNSNIQTLSEGFGGWRQLIAGGLGHPKPSVKIVNNSWLYDAKHKKTLGYENYMQLSGKLQASESESRTIGIYVT